MQLQLAPVWFGEFAERLSIARPARASAVVATITSSRRLTLRQVLNVPTPACPETHRPVGGGPRCLHQRQASQRKTGGHVNTTSGQDAVTRAQRWALALSSVASFMVVLDLLVVATALSTIRRDLGASIGQLEWTINAYTLAFAVLLMTAAAVGDRFGRRRVSAIGLGVFAVGSAACARARGRLADRGAHGPGHRRGDGHAAGAGAAERGRPAAAPRLGDGDLRRGDRAGGRGGAGARRRDHPGHRLAVDLLAERADRPADHPAGAPPLGGELTGRAQRWICPAWLWAPARRSGWCGG